MNLFQEILRGIIPQNTYMLWSKQYHCLVLKHKTSTSTYLICGLISNLAEKQTLTHNEWRQPAVCHSFMPFSMEAWRDNKSLRGLWKFLLIFLQKTHLLVLTSVDWVQIILWCTDIKDISMNRQGESKPYIVWNFAYNSPTAMLESTVLLCSP